MKKLKIYWLDFLATMFSAKKLACFAHSCVGSNEELLFEAKNAPKILLAYAKYYFIDATPQLKLFDLPNAKEVLAAYIERRPLSKQAELKLFQHPDPEMSDLVKRYLCSFCPHDEIIEVIFSRPDMEELITHYLQNKDTGYVTNYTYLKVLETNNKELIKLCLKNAYINSAKVQEKLFARPDFEELFKETCPRLNDESVLKLFDMPNVQELLLCYIEKHELPVKAQLKLLEISKKTAEPIMREYAARYGFSQEFRSRLEIDTYLLHWYY